MPTTNGATYFTPAPVRHRVSSVILDTMEAIAKPAFEKTLVASVGLFAARCLAPSIVTGVTYSSVMVFATIDSALKLALNAPSTWFYREVVAQFLNDSEWIHSWKNEAFDLTTELGAVAITATVLGMPISSTLACAIIYELINDTRFRTPPQRETEITHRM